MDTSEIKWQWYDFDELSPQLLYFILEFRQNIFAIEQEVVYKDLDFLDFNAKHLVGTYKDKTIAELRLLPPDKEGYINFGRFTVHKDYRGHKIGHLLMEKLFEYLKQTNSKYPIKIIAQHYLEKFYNQYGFKTVSKPYVFEAVKHVDMIRAAS